MGAYIKKLTKKFINLLTYCGQIRILEMFLFWYYINFINRSCPWFHRKLKLHLFWNMPFLLKRFHFFKGFLPISLWNMFHSSGEGFRTYVAIFLAPVCVFALMSGVSLANDGILFSYLLFVFPIGCFLFYFIWWSLINMWVLRK